MSWTIERKRAAAFQAPMAPIMLRLGARVIERPGWYQVVTPSISSGGLDEIIYSQVDGLDAERVIDDTIRAWRERGGSLKWCVGPWTEPEDFGERLARRGFSSWDVRGMASETDRSIAAHTVTVEEAGRETLEPFVEAVMRGWGRPPDDMPAELELHRTALRSQPREAYFFMARVDGEIVATTGLHLRGDYGYLVGAQVGTAFRGRGIYGALVAARLQFLARRGIGIAVTQAREATSAPLLERLGFETVFRSKCYLLESPPA